MTYSTLRTPLLFAVAAILTACMQDTGMKNQVNFIETQPFAAPKELTLSDRSAARMTVARRFAQTVPTTVTFTEGSSLLTPQARNQLQMQADFMSAYPELTFFVVGHADGTPSTSEDIELAQTRADTVSRFLTSLGVSDTQLSRKFASTEQDFRALYGDGLASRAVTEVQGFRVTTIPNVAELSSREI